MPYSSRPEAVPTAATAQKVAAVDKPRTVLPRRRITPAPMKPTPVAMAPSVAPGLLPGDEAYLAVWPIGHNVEGFHVVFVTSRPSWLKKLSKGLD